jgi:pimeloyl-ACP methyl ester carboxylesterase
MATILHAAGFRGVGGMPKPTPAPRLAAVRVGRFAIAILVPALLGAAPALAQDPAPGTPEWHQREAENYAYAHGRAEDRSTNPAAGSPGSVDPLRAIDRWNGARGEVIDVEYRNRYRARIVGHLWRPKGPIDGPLPAVVFVNGYGSADDSYFWAAEDLAEHGYLVLTFDPQGSGGSDTKPAPEYCEPGGAWTQPQEMGIREQGSCAGQDPDDAQFREAEGLTFVATGKVGNEDARGTAAVYREIAPRFVFGTLDAVDYLLSDRNPWRSLVDAQRVGVAGHSAGAWAALMVASGDPKRRFRAGVAMDAYHGFDFGVTGSTPTLLLQGEQENVAGPRTVPPSDPRSPDQLHATRGVFADLRDRGIDTGFYVLRGSTHNEFTDVFTQASREGQRVATHLTIAWFDAHLRDGAAARDGAARLRNERLDGTADASSIGAGATDSSGANVPYTIAGDRLADHLSFYYPTDLFDGGRLCLDLRLRPCVLPPDVGVAQPGPTVCASRRRFVIHLRSFGRGRLVSARVYVDGRRVKVRRAGRRLVAVVDLRGVGRRVVVVRTVARTRKGRVVRETRRYRTCVPGRSRQR